MSTLALSRAMRETLMIIVRNGGEIECRVGGYWTFLSAPTNDRGAPTWYASTSTIRALSDRGLLSLRIVPPRTFASNGTITEAGRAAVAKESVRDQPVYQDAVGITVACISACAESILANMRNETCAAPITIEQHDRLRAIYDDVLEVQHEIVHGVVSPK